MAGPGDNPAVSVYDWRNFGAPSPAGAYQAGTSYRVGNWCIYGGTTYRCIQGPGSGHQPDVSPTWWAAETKSWILLLGYAAGTTYASGAWVYYGTTYYRSLQAANVGHQPDVSPTWWEELDPTPYSLLHEYLEQVPGYPLWWSTWLGGICALKAAARPDHWSECEADAGGLGPAVRVDTASGDCYMAIHNYGIGRIDLYRRKDGVATFLAGYYSTDPDYGPQATKLACDGRDLYVYVRTGPSGGGPGYDPYELQIATYPWEQIGHYTDSSADALLTGKPGVWAPRGTADYPAHTPSGGEQTSHWSYADYGPTIALPAPLPAASYASTTGTISGSDVILDATERVAWTAEG